MFGRYLSASVVALGGDYLVLIGLVALTAWPQSLSAAIAYCAGAVVHYVISRRYVFTAGWLHARRLAEFAGFLASGLAGLAITVGVVQAGSQLQAPLLASKTVAVALSFIATYLLRRGWVFRARHRPASGTADGASD